jgi:hypothetical protein
MDKNIVIPKQERSWDINPLSDAPRYLLGVMNNFYLDELEFEIEPESDEFWFFNTKRREFSRRIYRSEELPYETSYIDDEFFIATRTKFIIKDDVTFEGFFRAMKKPEKVLLLPDHADVFYYDLENLFEVIPGARFAEQLSRLLDSPGIKSEVLSIPMLDRGSGQEIGLEFVVTELFDWVFVRLAAIVYDGTRLEHWIDKIDRSTNVYRLGSDNITPLKDSYVACAWTTEDKLSACDELVYWLLDFEGIRDRFQGNVRTLIGDIALSLRLGTCDFNKDEPMFDVKFDILEPDYTVFLE